MDEQFSKWWEEIARGDLKLVSEHNLALAAWTFAYSLGLAKGRKEGMVEAAEIAIKYDERPDMNRFGGAGSYVADAIRQAAQGGEGGRVKIDHAREVLTEVMHKYFTDKTYGHYIANELAGDFAAELAEAFIAAQTADRVAGGECCDWTRPDDWGGMHDTGCGHLIDYESDFKTCPYCSKPIHVKEP